MGTYFLSRPRGDYGALWQGSGEEETASRGHPAAGVECSELIVSS